MYNGIGPSAGGLGGGVLAYTGTGSLVVPIVIAAVGLAIGLALLVRNRLLVQD
jgi:hypothetical protein